MEAARGDSYVLVWGAPGMMMMRTICIWFNSTLPV